MKKSFSFNLMGVLGAAAIATLFTIVLSFTSPVRAAMVRATHVETITSGFSSLPFFDPTLGSLNRVQMGFNFQVPVILTFSNSSSSPVNVSLAAHTLKAIATHPNTGLAVLSLGEHVLSESYFIPAATQQCFPFIGCLPPTPGTRAPVTNTYSFGGGLDSKPRIIDPIGHPPFVDPNFPGFSVGSFVWNGVGNGRFGATTNGVLDPPFGLQPFAPIRPTIGSANGSVTVVYTYEAAAPAVVPVPSALPLFLTGLICLGFVARRQNRAA